VRVGVRGRRKVALPDVLTVPRPRRPAEVKQADPAMPKIVRWERRHRRRRARPRERRPEPVAAEAQELAPTSLTRLHPRPPKASAGDFETPAPLTVSQRDQGGELERLAQVELADLAGFDLRDDKVAALESSA